MPPSERGPNVFGGQLLAQMVVAATRTLGGRDLTSLHAVFSRAARVDEELYFVTDVLADGRNASSARVTAQQADRPCVDALALALRPQDLAPAHLVAMPSDASAPERATEMPFGFGGVEFRIVGDVDLSDAAPGGAPDLLVWGRSTVPVDSVEAGQAMLAYASEPLFVGTALLPHDGYSQSHAYSTFVPAVVSHTVAFHDTTVGRGGWWLFVLSSPHLAGGRVFGRADVFTDDGILLASVTQENLLRPIAG
jgi:acyl-CoA thioesterase II